MHLKGYALSLGLGAVAGMAAGAVAVLLMPKHNPARQLAAEAADKVSDAALRVTDSVEDAAERVSDMLTDRTEM